MTSTAEPQAAGNVDAGKTSTTSGGEYGASWMEYVKGNDLINLLGMLICLNKICIQNTAGGKEDSNIPRDPNLKVNGPMNIELAEGNADAGQTSATSGSEYHVIWMNYAPTDDLVDISGMFKYFEDSNENTAGGKEDSNIPRVPKKLRDKQNWKELFEPSVVSIGPYHHENPNLKVKGWMKKKLAKNFEEKHAVNRVNACRRIRSKIIRLKELYGPDARSNYDDDELAALFYLNGCVVLHFISITCGHDTQTPRLEKLEGLECELVATDRLAFQRDIMLLENQLPYQVLQYIICSSKESKKLEKLVRKFIRSLMDQPESEENQDLKQEIPFYHLLHGMWTSFTSSVGTKSSNFKHVVMANSVKIIGMALYILVWIIANLFVILLPKPTTNSPPFPKIEEMKEGGVMFKFNDTGSVADISFSWGTLRLPFIILDEAKQSLLLNLIAFEASSKFSHRFEVSSYIHFIAQLVRQPQDVEVLKDSKILRSHDHSDKEVVEIFKNLSSSLDQVFIDNHRAIRAQIHTHCKKKYNVWIAQLTTMYLESSWTVIALLGVIITFFFSFLQALYSVLGFQKGN